ncbi:hypothetical protein FRC07_013434 [Ceratobasidium sp. 392]|nr:hypothetical protein FRC07_013434 [Ceratobasidium sp. 392]
MEPFISNSDQPAPAQPPLRDSDPTRNKPLYKRWTPANRLATASLVSSRELLNRANKWSSSSTREGLLVMRFRQGWRHDSCIVERWYQAQVERSQQHRSATHFTVVQHRSTLNAPFFHEFLLIPLADGSFYRLERTGVGSGVDALRTAGCKSCDLIEWFPTNKYETFVRDKPSRLVAEVRFPAEFDILDVLAVCYSIQNNERASRYTLQCFNCYFFCCAVLSILARRVAGWENKITLDRGNELVVEALRDMTVLSSNPLKSEAKKYFALRVCSLLDPDSPQPAEPMIYLLGKKIAKHDVIGEILKHSLWWSNYGALVFRLMDSDASPRASFIANMDLFTTHMLIWNCFEEELPYFCIPRDSSPTAQALRLILAGCTDDSSDISSEDATHSLVDDVRAADFSGDRTDASSAPKSEEHNYIMQVYKEEVGYALIQRRIAIRNEFKAWGRTKQVVGWRDRLLAATLSPIAAYQIGIATMIAHEDGEISLCKGMTRRARLRLGAKAFFGNLPLGWALFMTPTMLTVAQVLDSNPGAYPALYESATDAGSILLNKLERKGPLTPDQTLKACQVMQKYDFVSEWTDSILFLLSKTLSHVVRAELAGSSTTLKLVRPNRDGTSSSSEVTVFELHEHIRDHIKTYAKRVQKHQLDIAETVRKDAERALHEIWMELPGSKDASSPSETYKYRF